MTQQEKEKMFLDLNSVLVKFWKEQGSPDKEVKIELLERMLNWYKKMGTVTLDKQSKEPVNEDLEEEIEKYFDGWVDDPEYGQAVLPHTYECVGVSDCKDIARHFAVWQKRQMLKDAIHYVVQDDLDSHGASYNIPFIRIGTTALKPKGIGVGDKVKIVIIPIKED